MDWEKRLYLPYVNLSAKCSRYNVPDLNPFQEIMWSQLKLDNLKNEVYPSG